MSHEDIEEVGHLLCLVVPWGGAAIKVISNRGGAEWLPSRVGLNFKAASNGIG